MIKRRYGMHTLNITQSRYKGMTHYWENAYDIIDNTDAYFYAPCDLEVIGVYPYASTGFANTVHFYDGSHTIAMTHENELLPKHYVGAKFKKDEAIYKMGVTGKATGPHIHMEVAEGRHVGKTQYANGWALPLDKQVNIEDYFFIDDTFTKTVNDFGLKFTHGGKTFMEYGYKKYEYNGITIHAVRGSSANGYGLHMIAANGENAVQDIMEFDSDKLIILGAVNGNYFQMADGRHLGVEGDGTVLGYHQEPKQAGFLAYSEGKDGETGVITSDRYWLEQEDVNFVCSPYAVRMLGGKLTYDRSTACGDKDNIQGTQTAAVKFSNGDWAIAIFDNCYPRDVAAWAQTLDGAEDLILMDSGGSTQMFECTSGSRKAVKVTGRKIADVLCIAKKAKNEPNSNDPEKDEEEHEKEENIEKPGENDETEDETGPGETLIEKRLKELELKVEKFERIMELIKDVLEG